MGKRVRSRAARGVWVQAQDSLSEEVTFDRGLTEMRAGAMWISWDSRCEGPGVGVVMTKEQLGVRCGVTEGLVGRAVVGEVRGAPGADWGWGALTPGEVRVSQGFEQRLVSQQDPLAAAWQPG